VEQVAATGPTYGYRRLIAQLKRQGWLVNWQKGATAHGSTRSSGEGLPQEKAHYQQQPRFPPLSQSGTRPGGGTSRPTLVGGINYIKLRWEFIYLAVLVDVFTRCIRGWDLGVKPESGADPSNLAEGTGPAYSRDSPLRPESPVCGYRLCSAIDRV
jgi:putative transposase